MWQDYFTYTALINLRKRPDRLESAIKVLTDFEINCEIWEATEDINYPCRGLVDSMQRYFRKVLNEGGERCLLFEDDITPLTDRETFDDTMDKCVEQLPQDWGLFYLGCNVAGGLNSFYSKNLLPTRIAYATHATAYSKAAMLHIIKTEIKEPVDNYLVRTYQPNAKVYVSYPMLMSQEAGHSDIGGQYTDWSRFLEVRYEAEIKKLL